MPVRRKVVKRKTYKKVKYVARKRAKVVRRKITKRKAISSFVPPVVTFVAPPLPFIPPTTPIEYKGTYKFVNSDKTGTYLYDESTHFLLYEKAASRRGLLTSDFPPNYQSLIVLSKRSKIPIEVVNSNVSIEIASPANAGALFVIPSQFNGVEYPHPDHVVRQFAEYLSDHTGGPAAQLAVHPAVGQFLLDTAFMTNTLAALMQQIPKMKMVNGYLKVPQGQVAAADVLAHLDKIAILMMANALVVGGTHRVNMVYASGVPINAYTNMYSDENLRLIAYYIMVAQYFIVLDAAAVIGKNVKVFLMLLGAGVFNNRICEDTVAAIKTALYLLEQKHTSSPLIQVKILTFKGNPAEYKAVVECLAK